MACSTWLVRCAKETDNNDESYQEREMALFDSNSKWGTCMQISVLTYTVGLYSELVMPEVHYTRFHVTSLVDVELG